MTLLIITSSRPQHWKKLKDILQEKLTEAEQQPVQAILSTACGSSTVIQDSIDSAILGLGNYANNAPSETVNKILLGLQKAARLGDIAIQHSPEVTALVWAGVRFFLEVCIKLIIYKNNTTNLPSCGSGSGQSCGDEASYGVCSKDHFHFTGTLQILRTLWILLNYFH